MFWTPTVQTVPLDKGYGASIELGRFTAPVCSMMIRWPRSSLPRNGGTEY
jgi:hypothetical protein